MTRAYTTSDEHRQQCGCPSCRRKVDQNLDILPTTITAKAAKIHLHRGNHDRRGIFAVFTAVAVIAIPGLPIEFTCGSPAIADTDDSGRSASGGSSMQRAGLVTSKLAISVVFEDDDDG